MYKTTLDQLNIVSLKAMNKQYLITLLFFFEFSLSSENNRKNLVLKIATQNKNGI